ncbi:hypothetical protein VTK26DRAFT_6012 [Humicola hyalothermophila]
MVDIARAQPHILRIVVAVACILGVFVFFDPIGYISTSIGPSHLPGETRSVTHIVLFQFKPTADHAAVDAACANFLSLKEKCMQPNSKHTYIQSITGGRDISNEKLQDGLTHAFVVQFGNTDDRNYYVEHDPAHQEFKKEIDPLVEKVTVLDFTNGKF